jgi:peroxiredoxin
LSSKETATDNNAGRTTTTRHKKSPSQPGKRARRRQSRYRSPVFLLLLVGGAIIVLGAIFALNYQGRASSGTSQGNASSGANQAGQYAFQVGQPGPGVQAPAIQLASTDGKIFDLAAMHGKTVLLYFQEGIDCQPCWDQMKDIQANWSSFQTLHIDQMVSITSDPLSALQQKVSDEGLTIPVLSDPNLAVSQTYAANQYGMMGTSRDGHTFILVGPDGRIVWRADYGGAPKYTMDVPVEALLADLRVGMQGK